MGEGRTRVPATEPDRDPRVSGDRPIPTSRRARLDPCRAPSYDPDAKKIYAALNYPGVVSHVGGNRHRRPDASSSSPTSRGRRSSLSRPWRGIPAIGCCSTPRTTARFGISMRLDPATRRQRDPDEGRAHRRPCVQPRRSIAVGHPAPERAVHARAHDAAPYRDWTQVVTWPYGTVMYDLDVSPDGSRVSASFGEISGTAERCGFSTPRRSPGPHATPVATFDFGTAVPNGFTFTPDGRALYGSSYFTGVSNIFRYDLERKKLDAVTQHRDRVFSAGAAGRRRPDRVPLLGRRFRAGARSSRARSRTSGRSPFSANGWQTSTRSLKSWMLGSPGGGAVRLDAATDAGSTGWPAA